MTRHFTTSACRSPYVSFGRRGASGTPTTTLRRGASSPSMRTPRERTVTWPGRTRLVVAAAATSLVLAIPVAAASPAGAAGAGTVRANTAAPGVPGATFHGKHRQIQAALPILHIMGLCCRRPRFALALAR